MSHNCHTAARLLPDVPLPFTLLNFLKTGTLVLRPVRSENAQLCLMNDKFCKCVFHNQGQVKRSYSSTIFMKNVRNAVEDNPDICVAPGDNLCAWLFTEAGLMLGRHIRALSRLVG